MERDRDWSVVSGQDPTFAGNMEGIMRTYEEHMEDIWRIYIDNIWKTYGGHLDV